MLTINKTIFPLAEKIVRNLAPKIKYLIITSSPKASAAGYYRKSTQTICLNIGIIHKMYYRFNIEYGTIENKLRVAAAIIYEECYHACHQGLTSNTEKGAAIFAAKKAKEVPLSTLYKHGGTLYTAQKTFKWRKTKCQTPCHSNLIKKHN